MGLIVVLMTSLLLWLTDERLTQLAVSQLEKNLAGRFELGALTFRLPGKLSLRGLSVRAPSGVQVLRLSELELELRPSKLIDAELWVDRLRVDGLEVWYAASASGSELEAAFAPRIPSRAEAARSSEPRAPLPIRLRGFDLRSTLHVKAHGLDEEARLQIRGLEADWRAALDLSARAINLQTASFSSTTSIDSRLLPEAERRVALRMQLGLDSKTLLESSLLSAAPPSVRRLIIDLDPRRLELAATFERGVVSLAKAQVMLAEGSIGLGGSAHLLGATAGQHQLSLSVQLRDLRAALASVARPELLPESLTASLRAEGQGLFEPRSRLTAEIGTAGRPSVLPEPSGDTAQLAFEADLEPEALRIERATFELGSTRMRVSGVLPFAVGASADLSAQISDSDVGRLLASPLARNWSLEAGLRATGPIDRPALDLDLALRPGALGETRAKLRITPERSMTGSLAIRALPLAPFASGVVTGTVSADFVLSGEVEAPQARGRAEVRGLEIAKLRFSEAEFELEVSPKSVTFEKLRLRPAVREGGLFTGSARFGLDDQRIEAQLAGLGLSSEILSPFVPALSGLGALGDLEVRAEGDLGSINTALTLSGPVVELELDLAVQPRKRTLRARSKGHVIELSKLASALGAELSGRLDFELAADGPFDRPDLRARLGAPALAYGGRALGALSANVRTSTGTYPYRVRAALGRGLEVQAELAPDPIRARAKIHLRDFAPDHLLPELAASGTRARMSGEASLEFGADGLRAEARLPSVSLDHPSGRLETKTPLQLRFDGETVFIDAWELAGTAGALSIGGQASPNMLELDGQARLELAMVAPFVPALVAAEGHLDLELSLRGSPKKPQGLATLKVNSPLRLQPRGLPMDVEVSGGRVVWTGSEIEVSGVKGQFGSGSFGMEGKIFLEGMTPRRYQLAVEGFGLPWRTRDLSIEANVMLAIGGDGAIPDISGKIDLVRGRVLRKFELQDLTLSSEPNLSAPLSETAPELGSMDLDISIESSSGIDVSVDLRTIGVQLTLETDLRLKGTPLAPLVEGKVAVPRGQLRFPAGTLFVNQASIDFQPGRGGRLGAEVDLEAEGEIESKGDEVPYFVALRLQGDLSELDLALSAQPFLEEREVLLLLLTGYAGFQGAEGDSRARDAALALAGTQLVGPVADFFSNQLDDLFNLDVKLGLEVTGEGVRVSAQKDLSRRLRLEGAYSTGDGGGGQSASARARFFLLDRLTLESSFKQVYGSQTSGGTGDDAAEQKLELKLRVLGY